MSIDQDRMNVDGSMFNMDFDEDYMKLGDEDSYLLNAPLDYISRTLINDNSVLEDEYLENNPSFDLHENNNNNNNNNNNSAYQTNPDERVMSSSNNYPTIPPTVRISLTNDDLLQTELSLYEKSKLHADILLLSSEKLAQIIAIIEKTTIECISRTDDEIQLDLTKADTKTLRHLQKHLEKQMMITLPHSSHGFNLEQGVWTPLNSRLSVGDLLSPKRKTLHVSRQPHTVDQREAMLKFWKDRNWKPIAAKEEMISKANNIGVTFKQLRVFRTNNLKRHSTSIEARRNIINE